MSILYQIDNHTQTGCGFCQFLHKIMKSLSCQILERQAFQCTKLLLQLGTLVSIACISHISLLHAATATMK